MNQLCTIRADEVRPGDVILLEDDVFDVGQVTSTKTGYIGLYARGDDWRIYRKADAEVQVRLGQSIEEVDLPLDWQDRVVIWGSMVCGACCLAILAWGPR